MIDTILKAMNSEPGGGPAHHWQGRAGSLSTLGNSVAENIRGGFDLVDGEYELVDGIAQSEELDVGLKHEH